MSGRSGPALASLLANVPSLIHLNAGWNDMRAGGGGGSLIAAVVVRPGRLVSLDLSFNRLGDEVGVTTFANIGWQI